MVVELLQIFIRLIDKKAVWRYEVIKILHVIIISDLLSLVLMLPTGRTYGWTEVFTSRCFLSVRSTMPFMQLFLCVCF